MLVGEFDEDVLQAGSERANLGDRDAVFQELVAKVVEIEMIVDERMNGLSENGGAANAGEMARETKRARNFRRGDFDAQRALRLDVRKIPELAARDGVDAGSGLIEEKEFRLVQHGAAECQALLPAAGELRGQAIQIGFEAVQLDNFVDAAFKAGGFEAVDAAVELQVFRDGQIVVEAEIL